jgi:hypothetical protein
MEGPVTDFDLLHYGQEKGKAIPLQTWRGPEGSRSLSFSDLKTIGI